MRVRSMPGSGGAEAFGRPLVASLFVSSALLSIVSWYTTQQGMALYLSPWFAFLASLGVQSALVADFIPSGRRGAAFGVFHGAVGLAALPASLLFGVFWTAIGPRWAFGIGAGLAGLAAILMAVLLSTTRKPAKQRR